MNSARITIRNYRCFEDRNQTSILLGPGFTAFVGQNNAGKSSLLKLFYELRHLWGVIGPTGNFESLLRGGQQVVVPQGVLDPNEIFFDGNERSIEIQLDWDIPYEQGQPFPISRVVFQCTRNNVNWTMRAFYQAPDYRDVREVLDQQQAIGLTQDGFVVKASDNHRLFDCRLVWSFASSASTSIYIGPFRNAINEGAAQYFDIAVGSAFVNTWHSWKAGDIKTQNLAVHRVTEDIRHIFDFRTLEINAAANMKTLNLIVDGRSYKLHELGAGLSQFIIVLANAMIRRPDLILIDEPELNLHPALQIDFLTTLASYARHGVVFATHSIGLARAVAERIFTFQKADGIKATPFEQTSNYAEFLGEMSFAAFKEIGCERVLLVEGVRDVKTVHQFLRKLGLDHRVVVIPLGGDQLARGGVELELAEIGRLTNKVSVLVDSEREKQNDPPRRDRLQFADLCNRLGFDVCVTERRAIENYFSDAAIKAIKGHKYAALRPFERLKDAALPWSKEENWRIAREMSFEDLRETDVGSFFLKLQ